MPTLNQSKVDPKNNLNMRGVLSSQEVVGLDAAIAADEEVLVDFLTDMEKTASRDLTAKRVQILTARDPGTRKTLQEEARSLIFKKVGAQAYLRAME